MNNKMLADLLFPNVKHSAEYYLENNKKRKLCK